MKNTYLIFLALVIFTACSTDDDNQILGEWKLVKAEQFGVTGNNEYVLGTVNYTNDNITYSFNSNGTLLVNSSGIGHESGSYTYVFGEGYLSGSPMREDPIIPLVWINNIKWTVVFNNGIMVLGNSHVDGPDLFFERK